MKRSLFLLIVLGSLGSLNSFGQNAAGGAQSSPPPNPPGNLPPGLERREQLPPGLQNREQLPPGLANRTNQFENDARFEPTNQFANTNQFGQFGGANQVPVPTPLGGATNQFSGATNQFGAQQNQFQGQPNQPGAADQFGLTPGQNPLPPTGAAGATNRVFNTNSMAGLTNANARFQDQAFTEADRTILVQVRQAVLPRIRSVTGPWAPVHFNVREGIVTIIGIVQTIEIKQQIVAVVTQVPGVAQVVDQLTIGAPGQQLQTLSSTDQVLLTRVRQTVLPQIQANGLVIPIDFNVQQGVVTVIGTVPDAGQKQRVLSLVQQVPGVVQVTDQVRVGAQQ